MKTNTIPYNQLKGPQIDAMVGQILGVEPEGWTITTDVFVLAGVHEKAWLENKLRFFTDNPRIIPIYPPYHRSVDACLEGLKGKFKVCVDAYINGVISVEVEQGERVIHVYEPSITDAATALCITILRFGGKEITP